jgi:hypothetical protein
MSNECAVDLVLLIEESTRTVTSGSARQRVRTCSKMSADTSTGALPVSSGSGFTEQMMPGQVVGPGWMPDTLQHEPVPLVARQQSL